MSVTASPDQQPFTTPPPGSGPPYVPQPVDKRPTSVILVVGAAVLLIVAAGITAAVFAMKPTGPDPKDPKSAIPACREQVRARMKAPATTQFPGGETVGDNGDQPQIGGVYDSQNGFGALVRGSYTCLLSHDDHGNVQVASVDVHE